MLVGSTSLEVLGKVGEALFRVGLEGFEGAQEVCVLLGVIITQGFVFLHLLSKFISELRTVIVIL